MVMAVTVKVFLCRPEFGKKISCPKIFPENTDLATYKLSLLRLEPPGGPLQKEKEHILNARAVHFMD